MKFPQYIQTEAKDCGPTCIRIIAKHYGRDVNPQRLRDLSETTREGSSLLGLSEAAESIGFHTLGVQLSYEQLKDTHLPSIVHWNNEHYVVPYKIRKGKVYVSDPGFGLIQYDEQDFIKNWIGNDVTDKTQEGIALLMEPTPVLYTDELDEPEKFGFGFISRYLLKYRQFIWQLIIGLLAGSLLQLMLPFLTQSIVDVGIKTQDLNFIYLILLAQFFLFAGKTSLEVIRSWILLHLSTRINISIISDFFIKLMKLPISFFDTRMTGDLLQRINDHERIEKVLTTSSLNTLFSCFNLVVFSLVLAHYNLLIFGVFLIGSIAYLGWVLFFFKKRKELDYKRFAQISQEQSKVIELVNGMQEIKLHNAERKKRWNWEYVQARLFKIATKNLRLEQAQNIGSNMINELKNMLITVLAAQLVIEGVITLGMMLAITFITGQLNTPIVQLITFLRELQDARISTERLAEIHEKDEEDMDSERLVHEVKPNAGLTLNHVTFRYKGALQPVIKDLSLIIPPNKVTAIVGASGSGKTTLMKLLLRFYEVEKGDILFDQLNLNAISQKAWRDHCGVVMQEGYIFNDSIANNIAVGQDYIDKEKLAKAVDVANLSEFIEQLPSHYNTKVGQEGIGLSTGQKQRLLIARAVYKDPKLIFFDEATSALDAHNERVIMEKLNTFLETKTAVVIAHRLSTVKNADQIVVMDGGRIVEKGTHEQLSLKKGNYYQLVKNQLELGS